MPNWKVVWSLHCLFYFIPVHLFTERSTEVLKQNEVKKLQSNRVLQGDGWKEQQWCFIPEKVLSLTEMSICYFDEILRKLSGKLVIHLSEKWHSSFMSQNSKQMKRSLEGICVAPSLWVVALGFFFILLWSIWDLPLNTSMTDFTLR